jgi:hypothetical protein
VDGLLCVFSLACAEKLKIGWLRHRAFAHIYYTWLLAYRALLGFCILIRDVELFIRDKNYSKNCKGTIKDFFDFIYSEYQ